MFLACLDRLYDPIDGLTSMCTDIQQHIAGVPSDQVSRFEKPSVVGQPLVDFVIELIRPKRAIKSCGI